MMGAILGVALGASIVLICLRLDRLIDLAENREQRKDDTL